MSASDLPLAFIALYQATPWSARNRPTSRVQTMLPQ